jgi:hypothetical protein
MLKVKVISLLSAVCLYLGKNKKSRFVTANGSGHGITYHPLKLYPPLSYILLGCRETSYQHAPWASHSLLVM